MANRDHIFFSCSFKNKAWHFILAGLNISRNVGDWCCELNWSIKNETDRAGQAILYKLPLMLGLSILDVEILSATTAVRIEKYEKKHEHQIYMVKPSHERNLHGTASDPLDQNRRYSFIERVNYMGGTLAFPKVSY